MTPNSTTVGNSILSAEDALDEWPRRNDDRFSSLTKSSSGARSMTEGPRMSRMLTKPPSDPTAMKPTSETRRALMGPCIISYRTDGWKPSLRVGSARELMSVRPPGFGSSGLAASRPKKRLPPQR